MGSLYKLVKGMDTISVALENIPEYFYAIILMFAAIILVMNYMILPKCKLSEDSKVKYRAYIGWILLVLYLGIVLLITIVTREPSGKYEIQLKPLSGIINFSHINREIVRDVLNLLLFVPVGMILYHRLKGRHAAFRAMIMSFLFSLVIEVVQLVFQLGLFDVDDLIFNTLGGFLGFLSIGLWMKLMSKEGWKKTTLKVLASISCVVLGCCLCLFGVYHFLRVRGMETSQINISNIESFLPQKEDVDESEREKLVEELRNDPSIIWYGGKPYRYNENLTTILAMGIDQRSAKIEQKYGVSGESGQADTIFLIVMDTKKDKMKMISMSRDTMCPVQTFDYKGNYIGDSKNHLGLAYAFGDGKHQSCQYMVDTVSNLFYGIPIHSYLALNMEAIIKINDAIGGVTVTVPEDLTAVDKTFEKGATVNLKGRPALLFIKWRNTWINHSNEQRMERQRIYIKSFMKQALDAIKKDLRLPVQIYNSLEDEMVTSITLEQVTHYATKVLSMQVDKANIVSLKGQAKVGTVYDEFYVDEDALYELIINTFYVEVPLGEENE